MQKPSGSSLDHNNNTNSSASSSALQQFKNTTKQTTSNQLKFQTKPFASPLNQITETEPVGSAIVYTRPPILKHQPKTGSLSSTASSSSHGVTSGSSFDSTTLSIENLTALYPLLRTDSLDKVTSERILSAQLTKSSSLINSHPHGKVARLERNLTDHRISTSSLNKSGC